MNNRCEYELIGTLMEHGRACLHDVMDVVRPDYFEVFELSEIYRAMLTLDREQKEITHGAIISKFPGVMLTAELKVTLSHAVQQACNPQTARNNAVWILETWKFKKAKEICGFFGGDSFDDISRYIAGTAEMLMAVAGFGDDSKVKSWRQVLKEAKEEAFAPADESNRIRMGLPGFDKLLGAIKPTDMALIAARPAIGKTALKEHIVRHLARQGKRILNVSLEMPGAQIGQRQLSAESGISLSDFRDGALSKKEQIEAAERNMQDWDIDVFDSSSMTPNKLQRIVQMKRYDVVFVDYGGLLQPDGKTANRQEEMASVSRALRGIAMGCKIPIVVLLQLNREIEKRSSGRVLLSDLKETGQWEADATHVVGMSKLEEDNILLEILKNRNGPCGTQIVRFDKPRMRFVELEERYVEPQKWRGMDS